MTEDISQEIQPMSSMPVQLALIINNKVVDVLHTDERLSAIFLSNPTMLDVSAWYSDPENVNKNLVDASYNQETQEFLLSSNA
jgi:hypothetical protein